jgi:DNA-binding NarL/FixJ family response regulator
MGSQVPAVEDSDAQDPAPEQIAVVLAERHAPMRRTLRRLIEAEEDLVLLAATGDHTSAEFWAARASGSIVVVDHRLLEDGTGYGVANLCACVRPAAVVLLSNEAFPALILRALRAGARAFVLKEHADTDLPAALRAVARGEEFVSPSAGTATHESCGIFP